MKADDDCEDAGCGGRGRRWLGEWCCREEQRECREDGSMKKMGLWGFDKTAPLLNGGNIQTTHGVVFVSNIFVSSYHYSFYEFPFKSVVISRSTKIHFERQNHWVFGFCNCGKKSHKFLFKTTSQYGPGITQFPLWKWVNSKQNTHERYNFHVDESASDQYGSNIQTSTGSHPESRNDPW